MKCLRPYLPKSPVVLSGLAVLTILVGFVIFLWLIGIFDLPPTDAGPQALVAVIGLLGALATATIAFLGILVKVTIDARSGERLKLEAAIQAVGLLSTSSGAEAPTSQKSGALFTLVELGQIGLALSLLENLWGGTNQLVASSACWVIGRGLESSDPSVQVRTRRHGEGTIFGSFYPQSFTHGQGINSTTLSPFSI